MIKDKIEEHQNVVVGVAIGVVVIMVTTFCFHRIFLQINFQFLNMMFSFAMCTMVK